MTNPTSSKELPQLISPDALAAYLAGPAPECTQFDFLVGAWDCETTRRAPDGSVLLTHHNEWTARWVAERRLLIDETTAVLGDGREIGRVATLRTWVPARERWEMTFLAAHQPSPVRSFHGRREGDEMHLLAEGRAPNGTEFQARVRFYDITSGSFEWEQHLSVDDGATWIRDVTMSARRRV